MRTRPLSLLFLAALAAVSLLLYLFPDRRPDPYGSRDGQTVCVQGSVSRKEKRITYTGEEVTLLYLTPDARPYERMEIRLAAGGAEPLTGQQAEVRGRLSCFAEATNPGVFDSRRHYALRGTACRLYDAQVLSVSGSGNAYREGLYRLRCTFAARLEEAFSAEDAALLKAMLLGDSSALDAETKRLYRMSGILHLLCVSGIHCALVGTTLFSLLKRLRVPRWLSSVLCCFVVYSYGLMCGMAVSALRAVCMFSLKLLAERLGRSYDMVSAMSLVGLLLLAEEPRYAQDSGFLMSFCTIAALGLMLPALFPHAGEREERTRLSRRVKVQGIFPTGRRVFGNRRTGGPAKYGGGCVMTEKILFGARAGISVLIFTLPVQMCCYHLVPLSGLLLNILLVPMMSVLMPAGMGVMLLAGVLPPLAALLSFVPHLMLRLVSLLSGTLASLPFLTWYAGAPAARQVILYYALLAVFLLRKPATGAERIPAAHLLPVIALAVLSLRSAPALQLTMLDVGQGDAIVVRQGEVNLLIDGGSTSVSGVGTYRLLPFLQHEGVRHLDAVFISHEDEDHISGVIELLEDTAAGGVSVGHLYLPDIGRGEVAGIRRTQAGKDTDAAAADGTAGATGSASASGNGGTPVADTGGTTGGVASVAGNSGKADGGMGGQHDADYAGIDAYEELVHCAMRRGIPVSFLHTGQTLQAGDLVLRCLGPSAEGAAARAESANEHSMILHLQYGAFSALFTGDVEGAGLTELNAVLASLPAELRRVDVLKVAHHGSRFTTDETFLSLLDARVALISCGRANRYGHPHAELLERLAADGARIYTTPESGAITVRTATDGASFTVEPYLQPE
ncbi:MAG: ComEC/Rec2 family competence protein [Lachnospiraceae bacterium]|nr:ComEC/Rec2 family competence protein [Lachnospiraceae bacterium]